MWIIWCLALCGIMYTVYSENAADPVSVVDISTGSPRQEQFTDIQILQQTGAHEQLQTTETHAPLQTSAYTPLQTSAHAPLQTSAHTPLQTSAHTPLQTNAHAPLQTSVHTPLQTSAHAPRQTSAHAQLQTSAHAPLQTSTHVPLQTSPHSPLHSTSLPGHHQTSPHQQTSHSQFHPQTTMPNHSNTDANLLIAMQRQLLEIQKTFNQVKQTVNGLTRQIMLQQLYVEEKTRSAGNSGVKQIRAVGGGTRPYHFNTFASSAVIGMHEHSNYERTIGLGELDAVLNGVEFRTRHNDYSLKMPSTTKSDYDAVEDVTFPPVPPSVLQKHTLQEQITELQQYFKAFHNQDTKIRNYKPYFKPVLCYLEGGWTTDTKTLTEPFHSERHFVDAVSWFNLQEKIRYTSSTGEKDQKENFMYLPTTIINVTADGEPIYAQWNYRIMCHPIKKEISLQDFRVVDDLSSRMRFRQNMSAFGHSKAARFTLAPYNSYGFNSDDGYGNHHDVQYLHGNIDAIMFEIPGKDNYKGNLTDNSFGVLKYRVDTKNDTVLDVSRYHRYFKVLQPGAMGLQIRNRGYADQTLWVAKTTNPRIAEMNVEDCQRNSKTNKMECIVYSGRHTYAFPLEIVWMTPLNSWNPYNLTVRHTNFELSAANGRNGGFDQNHAFNGSSLGSYYYLTPYEFYHGSAENRDPADTAKDVVGVLDSQGQVRNVTASGFRIFTPVIPNVGPVRIRYPIMPTHEEGTTTWKNLVALQDIMMDMKSYSNMFEKRPEIHDANAHMPDTHYVTSTTHMNPPGMHYHDLYLTAEEMMALSKNGTVVSVYTSENNGHQHELKLKLEPTTNERLKIVSCDSANTCWDHHDVYVFKKTN